MVVRRALALSWALGTSTGVLLGLAGVQLVTSGITGLRIAPLSRPEVLQALSAGNAAETPEAIAAPAITAPPASPDPGSAPPLADPVSKPVPTPPASAPPRSGATAGPPPAEAVTPPAPSPTPPPTVAAPPPEVPPAATATPPPTTTRKRQPKQPTTTTTTPAPSRSETHTISSRGGTAAVRYEGGDKVRLLWARPNRGYDVAVVDDGPERVFVRFKTDSARSRVYAFYRDGKPAEEVVERATADDREVEPKGYRPTSSDGDSDVKDTSDVREDWEQYLRETDYRRRRG